MQPLLEARDLHFVRQLDAGPLKVLDGVDLTVQRGEVVDVFGPSGAGKTTLLRALALLQPGVTGGAFVSTARDPRRWVNACGGPAWHSCRRSR